MSSITKKENDEDKLSPDIMIILVKHTKENVKLRDIYVNKNKVIYIVYWFVYLFYYESLFSDFVIQNTFSFFFIILIYLFEYISF